MIPILFKIGPLKVGSYGVMVAIAFLTCIWLLRKELTRKNFSPDWANNIIIVAAISGIIGARVYFIFEYFDEFLQDPFSMIFSGSGTGPDELTGREVALLRDHVGQQRIGRNVERHAEEQIGAALVQQAG